jgi:hypothetical protein
LFIIFATNNVACTSSCLLSLQQTALFCTSSCLLSLQETTLFCSSSCYLCNKQRYFARRLVCYLCSKHRCFARRLVCYLCNKRRCFARRLVIFATNNVVLHVFLFVMFATNEHRNKRRLTIQNRTRRFWRICSIRLERTSVSCVLFSPMTTAHPALSHLTTLEFGTITSQPGVLECHVILLLAIVVEYIIYVLFTYLY